MAEGQATQSRAYQLRARAEEIRTIAQTMQYAAPRSMMLRMAATFDKLADRLEGRQHGAITPPGHGAT